MTLFLEDAKPENSALVSITIYFQTLGKSAVPEGTRCFETAQKQTQTCKVENEEVMTHRGGIGGPTVSKMTVQKTHY